jgi:hypothetical protein
MFKTGLFNFKKNEAPKPPKLPQSPGATELTSAPAPPPPPPAKKWWSIKTKKAPTVETAPKPKKPEWKFDFVNCTTKQNLYDIKWSKVEGIQRSTDGSGGAYFTQLSTKPTHTRNISQQILDIWKKPSTTVALKEDRKPEAVVIKGGMDR